MATLDVLSQQLKSVMTAFGEHSYEESTVPKDPGGRVLSHEHNAPKQYRHDLEPYQREMASEEGLRELNSMQKFRGRV